MKVKDFMTDGIEAIPRTETVLNASRIMKKHNIGSLPILGDDSKVFGLITDRDIVLRVFADILPMNTRVEEVMTSPVYCICEDDEIGSAISLMADKQVRRLPVVDREEKIVGMISLGDLAIHQLTDGRATNALKEISETSTNVNKDLEVDDFNL
ncbi:MAG TPA: CBS domain-containing protein [Firmicutes bacterium]|nr:CBS domain-containing protein [Bacillota bacterium]